MGRDSRAGGRRQDSAGAASGVRLPWRRVLPDRIRTLADVERLLAATTNYEEKVPADGSARHFDLARMDGLLADLGRPERGPVTVHVTGSKGKGSTCRILDAILRAAGRGPVGLYVSPHLESLAERVSVDGRPVSGAALARATEALLPALRARVGTPAYPTFFELNNVMVPTAVVVGSRDLLTPPYHARKLMGSFSNATLHQLPGIGHQVMQEDPVALAAIIRSVAAGSRGLSHIGAPRRSGRMRKRR